MNLCLKIMPKLKEVKSCKACFVELVHVCICSKSYKLRHKSSTRYSCVPIKRAGPIKQAGRNFQENFRNEQALLNEQGGIFKETLEMSRLY